MPASWHTIAAFAVQTHGRIDLSLSLSLSLSVSVSPQPPPHPTPSHSHTLSHSFWLSVSVSAFVSLPLSLSHRALLAVIPRVLVHLVAARAANPVALVQEGLWVGG